MYGVVCRVGSSGLGIRSFGRRWIVAKTQLNLGFGVLRILGFVGFVFRVWVKSYSTKYKQQCII